MKTLAIARHELRQTLKRTSFILLTIGFPLVLLISRAGFGAINNWAQSAIEEGGKIAYVDQTGLFKGFTVQGGLTLVPYGREEDVKADLRNGSLERYFVIPADYVETGNVTIFTISPDLEISRQTRGNIANFLVANLLSEKVPANVLSRAQNPINDRIVRLDEKGEPSSDVNFWAAFLVPYAFGLLFMMAIFLTSGYLLQGVAEEKENRVVEVLLSSVSSAELLSGKILGLGAAGLAHMAVWLASVKAFAEVAAVDMPFLKGMEVPTYMLAWGLVYFLLGYLLFAALFAAVGAVGSTARESQQLSSLVAMPAAAPYFLQFIIVPQPEHPLSVAFSVFPLTAPIAMMMRLPSGVVAPWEHALSIALLVGAIALVTWAAARVFRLAALMYGQKPSLRQLWRYLHES